MDTLIGDTLGQYRITGVLGRGGMATVYRATQERLGRDVALKVLRASLDPQAAARFEREARSVASLSHQNILPVYDYGEDEGRRYIVTQYIEGGRSLATRLDEGPVPPAEASELLVRVLDALGYAHGRGVIHRDIKPANILLPRPDWPLLGDFGIAQSATEQTQLTAAGEIIGTPNYMAPERATGQPSDARADIYAMGVMLYELLTGRVPFDDDAPMAVLLKHIQAAPQPPSELNPAISPSMERVALRALEKDPARRFQSAGEMAAALRAAVMMPARPTPLDTALLEPEPVRVGPWPEDHHPTRKEPTPAPAPPQRDTAPAPPLIPPRQEVARRSRRGWLIAAGLLALLIAAFLLWPRGSESAAGLPIRLEESAWSGGYGGGDSEWTYGGRTPVVAYGVGSEFQGSRRDQIEASFTLAAVPRGEVALVIEGMDSENPAKTEIVIAVNGLTIYNGPNPLPDDDQPLETGTWASHRFPFDPNFLRAGENSMTISTTSPGKFSQPPFIIIDYATIE